jgi:hypothetical protein
MRRVVATGVTRATRATRAIRAIRAVVVASLALATTAPAWRASATEPSSSARAATLVDLHGPGDLRERFNSDLGKSRVVLLVSPT